MARKFLTALDLAKNELQNAAVQSLGSAPSAPVKFQLYGNTSDNTLYWWDGTTWIPAKATGSGFPGYGSVPAETTFGITKNDGAATTVARSDHTHGSPTHDAAAHSSIPISALAAATGTVNMNSQRIVGLADPTGNQDGATKNYVDNAIAGLSWKDSVRACSNVPIPANGVVDGVTLVSGDRVLAKNEGLSSLNGIYVYDGVSAYARAADANSASEILGMAVWVEQGTTFADTAWVCTADAPITISSTPLPFVQFAGGGIVTAGAGLTQSGNTLNVIGDATMVVTADQISQAPLTGDVTTPAGSNAATIAAGVVTNAKLATMPFITIKGNNTGSAGPPVDMTPSQLVTMLDANLTRRYSVACTAATSMLVNHAFGTQSVMVQVYRNSVPYDVVECDIEHTDMANVTVRFTTAPAAGAYQIMVVG